MMKLSEMPDILTTAQVSQIIGLSERRTRDRLNLSPKHGGIKNFSTSDSPKAERRILKSDLIHWIEARKRDHESRFAQ